MYALVKLASYEYTASHNYAFFFTMLTLNIHSLCFHNIFVNDSQLAMQ